MRSLPLTLILAIGCISTLPILAQPAKPTLELRTTPGQTTFHIGERIPLTLTLTGPDDMKYTIDTAGYDRSGRLDIDTFAVAPSTGWADPLAQYFSSGSVFGGGLRGSEPLSPKPVSFPANLNEHVRFDQPGTYTITATSHRVGSAAKSMMPGAPWLELTSNPIQVRIIPATPEWQAGKLREVLAILATPEKQPHFGSPAPERAAAAADLRFLNSPASLEILASQLREDRLDSTLNLMWDAALGLMGVPDSLRDTALHAMSHQLEAPDFPVCNFFLTTMADLSADPNQPSTQAFLNQRPEFKSVWQQALAGLSRKQGSALATTAETLLSDIPAGESRELKAQVAAIVAANFAALPIDRQVSQLEANWDELSTQPMLPIFEAIVHQLPAKSASPFNSAADLNAIVLKRWFQLEPEGALRALTAELASAGTAPTPAFSSRSIPSLPGGPQPQFEAQWARAFVESDTDDRQTLFATLLVRFGTGSATAQVEAKLDTLVGKWACQPQAAALAYIVKFHSDNAESLVQRAASSSENTHCYESLFSTVASLASGPALNQAAISALDNSNPRAAADAADYLHYFGTEAAKQPLLEHYRAWSERFANRPAEVDPSTEAGYPNSILGQNLGTALIANQGWLADAKLIAEVVSRCVGESMCRELHSLAADAAPPKPFVNLYGFNPNGTYRVNQYTAKSLDLFEAKIAQFPVGTHFTLVATSPHDGDQIKVEQEAAALCTQHGMTLESAASIPTPKLPQP